MKQNNNIHPASDVVMIHINELTPNLYNPNNVAKSEMQLLKTSILEDGWVFAILVLDKSIHIEGLTNNENRDKYTIIDGFHRYTLAKNDKDINKIMGGIVPCIVLNPKNPMRTTVRMNRAKGTHAVLEMSKIVKSEIEKGSSVEEIIDSYGMEREEVVRLMINVGVPLTESIVSHEYSKAWVPDFLEGEDSN